MGFLSFFRGNTTPQIPQQKDMALSVLSGTIFPSGDLSKPLVNDRYTGGGGYVLFGADNQYPDMLASLYYTSPLHHAIINYKRNAIAGHGFVTAYKSNGTATDLLNQAVFDRIIRRTHKHLALDLIMHSRMYLKLTFDDKGQLKTARRLDPTMIRHSRADIYGEVTTLFVNRDWSMGYGAEEIEVLDRSKVQQTAIYMYQDVTAGVPTYALPAYATAANWMFLDGEISMLHKSNILNSINPSYILNFPKMPANRQEQEKIKDMLESKGQGAKNAGRVITLFSPNREQMPDVITANSSQNDKLFMQTSKDLRDNICFSHEINPSLVGIKVAGQLGNSEELKASYAIFDENVIEPLQEILNEYYEILMDVAGLSGSVEFNKSKITFGD